MFLSAAFGTVIPVCCAREQKVGIVADNGYCSPAWKEKPGLFTLTRFAAD